MACNERVGRGTITWPCSLDENHPGPHYAVESNASQGDRRRWDAEQAEKIRHVASGLAEFQGPAQTTAQRYTDNPTPVPISAGRRRMHSDCTSLSGCLIDEHTECPYADFDLRAQELLQQRVAADLSNPGPESRPDFSRAESWPVSPRPQPTDVRNEVDESVTEAVPTKQRAGDQVLPDGTGLCVQDLVIEAMQESKRVGVERYGQTLRTFNGRRGFQDVHDEIRDLFVYLTQVKAESGAAREDLITVVQQAFRKEHQKVYEDDTQRPDLATLAVDRIMGWVTGQLTDRQQ